MSQQNMLSQTQQLFEFTISKQQRRKLLYIMTSFDKMLFFFVQDASFFLLVNFCLKFNKIFKMIFLILKITHEK